MRHYTTLWNINDRVIAHLLLGVAVKDFGTQSVFHEVVKFERLAFMDHSVYSSTLINLKLWPEVCCADSEHE